MNNSTITGYLIFLIFVSILAVVIAIYAFRLAREVMQAFSGYGVPFVRTNNSKMKMFLENLDLKEGNKFIDIGCGDGKILEAVSQKFPEAKIVGYEKSYYPYKLAMEKKNINGLDYEVKREDFFDISFEDVDVVYSYLMPHLMKKIWKKMQAECKKGTLLYSSSFPITGEKTFKIIEIGFRKSNNIFIYKV